MKLRVNIKNGSRFTATNPKIIARWKANRGTLVQSKESKKCLVCNKEVFDLKRHRKDSKH